MAIYPKNEKEYAGQSLNDKWTEVAKSENFKQAVASIAGEGGGGTLEILSTYPTTDASKAGQKFIYRANEWHYMTQDEIDSIGWTGLVSVGFPAPLSKSFNPDILFSGTYTLGYNNWVPAGDNYIDFLGLGNPTKLAGYNYATFVISNIIGVKNAHLLTGLEDVGTLQALNVANQGLTESALNDLFTQLPPTIKTVTINIQFNPGIGNCDRTIATSKGYTVVG